MYNCDKGSKYFIHVQCITIWVVLIKLLIKMCYEHVLWRKLFNAIFELYRQQILLQENYFAVSV